MTGHILIIDDEPQMGPALRRSLQSAGLDVDPEAGLRRMHEMPFDVLVTDLRMPGLDGLEVLRRARSIQPDCEVVLMTAHATVGSARDALKRGAIDYLTKPFSVARDLLPIVNDVLEVESTPAATPPVREFDRNARARERAVEPIGRSAAMQRALELAHKVARSAAPVLLLGESGSGKEVFAQLIHRLSPRADRSLFSINCAALPDSLLESELFGHAKGAFTGATQASKGIFAAADGGSLFLDEIGEMALSVQPKLLRVLQEGEIQRVGESGRTTKVDVRIIAATNRDLEAAVERGGFRSDLYYRLNVVPIEIPSLRDRIEDLPPLIEHFLDQLGSHARLTDEAILVMERYPWPGNVRELANAIEHAVVLGNGRELGLDDLPAAIQDGARASSDPSTSPTDDGTLESIERRTILQALERTRCHRTEAARLLGITRRTLGYRIKKYELEPEIDQILTGARDPSLPPRPPMRKTGPRSDVAETG